MSEPARLIDKQTNKPTDRQSLTPHPSIVGPGDIKGDQTGILWVGGQTTNIPLVECGQTERQTDSHERTIWVRARGKERVLKQLLPVRSRRRSVTRTSGRESG